MSKWWWLGLGLLALLLGQWLLDAYREEEKQLRGEWREGLLQRFPEQAEQLRQRYGLRPWGQAAAARQGRALVLIHGLDDPGKVWMNLAPALLQAGFAPWIMHYPDDQPISESAQLLAEQLQWLKAQGVGQLDIVAHSMGGLVSRELLTHPRWRDADLPRVDQLIMLGTPNQGSELARFRGLAEWRDQFAELLSGDFHWLGFIFDGAGEAGIDLLPGSRFLQRLNARPNPPHTRLTVIAAELGKADRQRLMQLARSDEHLAWLEPLASSLGNGLGDGLVTVGSARLPGARFYLLEGSHLSMIRNLLESSPRIPPAVPLVLRLLQEGAQTMTSMP
ncbi:MAG: alpha/beta fold hydrolase [Gammaproteobacteria bacterium SHHR-1]|uniref:lipase family alpha/beta hydrolase n=1 Tax=Magnetovirga frankeli TaxID=947516 RepID=UPI001293EA89|nr:alpha/beta fold hydrolase [gamma proteobacterium SS-5]